MHSGLVFFREIFYNQINNANGGLSMEKHQVLTVLVADDEPELLSADEYAKVVR